MKNPETKMCIELEGIILTEKALEKLRSLQANNNEYIEMNLKTIGDAVCRLACLMQECQMNIEQRTETTDIMSDLSFLRDNFVDLRKPWYSDCENGPNKKPGYSPGFLLEDEGCFSCMCFCKTISM